MISKKTKTNCMNLQVCLPYQPCWFNCPMCVARGHKHKYVFDNLYKEDKEAYLANLKDAVMSLGQSRSVILTGECDPTQDIEFCKEVIQLVRSIRPDLFIELQTRNYTYRGGLDVDVLSYSIVDIGGYNAASSFYKEKDAINRIVILLGDWTRILNNDTFDTKGFSQVTFKVLQYSEDKNVNEWINKHKLPSSHLEVIKGIKREGVSIKFDENCQSGIGRYLIFRSDGHIYTTWEEGIKG